MNKVENLYRGYVQFNQSFLSQFDSIVTATLKFNVSASFSQNSSEVVSQVPPVCNATTFGLATGNDEFNFDEPGSLPATCPPLQYSVDVTGWVSEWIGMNPNHLNFGFILAGPRLDFPSDLPADNDGNYTFYNKFYLEILYAPDSNCRLVDVPGAFPGPNCPVPPPPRFQPSPPVVTSIDPNSGPAAGGTTVTVIGTGFTDFTGVAFGGTASSNVVPDPNNPDTQLTADSPAGTSTVDVTVTTPAGTSPPTAADQFNYQ